MNPSITEAQVNTALGDFLQLVTGLPTVVGQVNRVPSLSGSFVVMWPLSRARLATNVETNEDAKFIGSIAATVLTVTEIDLGVIVSGRAMFGTGVADNTVLGTQLSGSPGGLGTYAVAPSQTLAPAILSAGGIAMEQSTELIMQIDVHGPGSADAAQVISTTLRSSYGAKLLEASGVSPLHADEPRQLAFITAAAEYEDRWSVDVHLQVNPIVTVAQEYADSVVVGLIEVDATYPP